MSNAKTDRTNELTGLAAECWAVLSSTYNPLAIMELCRKVEVMEKAKDELAGAVAELIPYYATAVVQAGGGEFNPTNGLTESELARYITATIAQRCG